jgi:hypothetical protein
MKDAFGNGGIFKRSKPRTFSNTELGFEGHEFRLASCEFGHFHVDAKEGQVMQMTEGKSQVDITNYNSGMRNWFKENLPFKILVRNGRNRYKQRFQRVGITMGWDSRFQQVIFNQERLYPIK